MAESRPEQDAICDLQDVQRKMEYSHQSGYISILSVSEMQRREDKMARTEAEMKEILADKLYIGKKVRGERFNTPLGKGNGPVEAVTLRGRVEGLYPHVFTARFGERLEAFQYSQVFIKERGRVILS